MSYKSCDCVINFVIDESGGNDQGKLNKNMVFLFIPLHDSTALENIKTNLVYVSALFVPVSFECFIGI